MLGTLELCGKSRRNSWIYSAGTGEKCHAPNVISPDFYKKINNGGTDSWLVL
jgi:hypothetical protein